MFAIFINQEPVWVPADCVLSSVIAQLEAEQDPTAQGYFYTLNGRIVSPPYALPVRDGDRVDSFPIPEGG